MPQTVVSFQEVEPNIIQVKMQDRKNKNTFSKELILGLIQSFERIQDNPNYKVVILTGYDSYFSSGGTQETLLSICEGKTTFPDAVKNIYNMALDCKIPVIAAMQGHAIGAGFTFGLYADFVILSQESVYTTNYMKYGFTPGMGSTYIVPMKLGFSLSEELLLNADNYRGVELEKRKIPFPVLPRVRVMEYAIDLARQLAEKPRISLITLKDHLVAPIRKQLPRAIVQEVQMHEKTIHKKEVRNQIIASYGI